MLIEQIETFHASAKELKEHQVQVHHQRDMEPRIGLVARDHDEMCTPDLRGIYPIVTMLLQAPPEWGAILGIRPGMSEMEALLAIAVQHFNDGSPGPLELEGVIVAADGYAKETLADAECSKGSFEDEYKNDPASGVFQMVTTTIIESDLVGGAQWASLASRYEVDDGCVVVWGEELLQTPDDGSECYFIGPVVERFKEQQS